VVSLTQPLVLVVANSKGGVGKSTLSVLTMIGFGAERISLVDTDPQRTSRIVAKALFGSSFGLFSESDFRDSFDLRAIQRRAEKSLQGDDVLIVDTFAGISAKTLHQANEGVVLAVPVSSSPPEMLATKDFLERLLVGGNSQRVVLFPNQCRSTADRLAVLSMFRQFKVYIGSSIPFDLSMQRIMSPSLFSSDVTPEILQTAYRVASEIAWAAGQMPPNKFMECEQRF